MHVSSNLVQAMVDIEKASKVDSSYPDVCHQKGQVSIIPLLELVLPDGSLTLVSRFKETNSYKCMLFTTDLFVAHLLKHLRSWQFTG